MSLNGLEAKEVNEAYQAALGEGGGWFLLRYVSRDEVALLARGNEGLVEVQEAVNRYEEQSPLFGFIHYRRRKVVLKYVPEGTSRLLQARLAVQFQSVTEKLTPNDTIFAFTKSSDLQDNSLASACSLHTATASIKSSNDSLLPRGLAGITEDVLESRVEVSENGEGAEDVKRGIVHRQMSDDSQTRRDRVNEAPSADHFQHRSSSVKTQRTLQRSRTLSNTNKALPPTPVANRTAKDPPRSVPQNVDNEPRPSVDGRMSSQSARPSTGDLYDAYGYKQKVKLGPRPSTDSVGQSSHVDRHNEFRPVSTLPAGLRMPTRKAIPPNTSSARPQSRQSQRASPEHLSVRPQSRQSQHALPETLSIKDRNPVIPVTPIQIPDRKAAVVSNGLLTPAKTPAETKSLKTPSITPEKRRLMKALELRQKQMAAQRFTDEIEVKEIPIEVEHAKPEIDDTVLSAILEASRPDIEPDIVHVPIKDLSKDENSNAEASPISLPEISEGPSTKASSVTDEEEVELRRAKELSTKGGPSMSFGDELVAGDDLDGTPRGPPPSNVDANEHGGDRITKPELIVPLSTHGNRAEKEGDQLTQQYTGLKDSASKEPEGLATDKIRKINSVASATNAKEIETTPHDGVVSEEVFKGSVNMISAASEGQSQSLPHAPSERAAMGDSQTKELDRMEESLLSSSDTKYNEERQMQSQPSSPVNSSASPVQIKLSSGAAANQDLPRKAFEPSIEYASAVADIPIHLVIDEGPEDVPIPGNGKDVERSDSSPLVASQQSPAIQSPTLNPEDYQPSEVPQNERWSKDTQRTITQPPRLEIVTDKQTRRRGLVDLPQRSLSPEPSDEHFLSDDSFMEELKSATVQEAQPISVSKSPTKPTFSRSESEQRLIDITKKSRSVSSPLDQSNKEDSILSSPRLAPSSSQRSFSASQSLHPENQQVAISKKIGVSSGISQRIKALEQLSSRPTSPQSQVAPSNAPILNLRKSSSKISTTASDLKVDFSQHRPTAATYPSPSPSPEALKSNPFNSISNASYARPESISVKATIVRDTSNKSPELPRNLAERQPMNLHPSPLIVERQAMPPPPLSPLKPPRPGYARHSSARSGSTSSMEQKGDTSPQAPRRGSLASLRSKSSRTGSEAELPRALSDSSLSEMPNGDDTRDSKRSRLMKRMSSISSMSRRSIANALSPGPKEAPIIERQEPIAEALPTSTEVGDVNIQFPDTLLWKRRHMIIDDQGILVLSASKSDNNLKVIPKRFPLSDVRSLYIPDQDRQELPNSVVLDLKDGSTLQCACEHPQGQADVLHTLKQAHLSHQSQ